MQPLMWFERGEAPFRRYIAPLPLTELCTKSVTCSINHVVVPKVISIRTWFLSEFLNRNLFCIYNYINF
jgi:hypothetical protein